MVKLMLEISDLLKKFFIDYAHKTHMNEWNNPDSFFKPENSIDEVVKECRTFEDMYAQKILQTIEKRIDEKLATERRTMNELLKTGRFREDSIVLVKIGSRIEAFITLKGILNKY